MKAIMPYETDRELTQALRNHLEGSGYEMESVWFREVTSTNDLMWELVHSGKAGKTAILAEFQSRGRGKFGARWVSPESQGICLSLAFPGPEKHPVLITGIGALAVRDVCREFGVETSAKWPNDILADSRKMCGILAESKTVENVEWMVLGIGCNINNTHDTLPEDFASITTSLRIERNEDGPVDRARFAGELILRLVYYYEKIESEAYQEIADDWFESLGLKGRTAVLKTKDGRQGILESLTPEGLFRVQYGSEIIQMDYDSMIILSEG